MTAERLLLDTCAIFYVAESRFARQEASAKVEAAALHEELFVSPISALEIGRLSASGRLPITADPSKFFSSFLAATGARLCSMEPNLLIESSYLPGKFHKDPVDRILVATARFHGYALVTSDRAILNYGQEGYLKTLAC